MTPKPFQATSRWASRLLAAALIGLLPLASHAADKLTVGVLKLASSGPVFIAQAKGYFEQEGVQVDLKFFDAAQPIAVAAASGDIDVGVTAFTAGFYTLAGKSGLRVIAGQSREEPGYHLIAYLATPKAYEEGLREPKDLAGKTVAITQVGSSFHYSLGLLADKYKFNLDSIKLRPVQSMGNMATTLAGGGVDAALIPATVAEPLIQSGKAKLIGWVGDQTPWQLGAVFTTEKEISKDRDALTKFLRAYKRACQDYYDAFLTKNAKGEPEKGKGAQEALDAIAKYTGQKPELIERGIAYIDPQGRFLATDVANQIKWYQAHGFVDASVDPAKIIDTSFGNAVK
jgi:NitT/TauT family transport system substrate-binding protein